MRKSFRIATEIFLPPAVAAAIINLLFVASPGSIRVKGLLLVFGVAYFYALLPSVAYAAVMEFAFARGLSPRSLSSVWLSSICGAGAGIVIGAVFPEPSVADMRSALWMALLGAIVGALTGVFLLLCARGSKNA